MIANKSIGYVSDTVRHKVEFYALEFVKGTLVWYTPGDFPTNTNSKEDAIHHVSNSMTIADPVAIAIWRDDGSAIVHLLPFNLPEGNLFDTTILWEVK